MKYVKILGLLAVAAAAPMAFVGTASATELTSSVGSTPTIQATSTNVAIDGPWVTIKCLKSQFEAQIESHGAGVPASGKLSTLHFTECNYPVTVNKVGTLSVTGTATTGDGTGMSSGIELSLHTSVGTCVVTTSNTDLGTLTGSNNTGGHAVLDLTSAPLHRTGGNFLCGTWGNWTGNYTITSPSSLEVH